MRALVVSQDRRHLFVTPWIRGTDLGLWAFSGTQKSLFLVRKISYFVEEKKAGLHINSETPETDF
jgi:hypothetical protein